MSPMREQCIAQFTACIIHSLTSAHYLGEQVFSTWTHRRPFVQPMAVIANTFVCRWLRLDFIIFISIYSYTTIAVSHYSLSSVYLHLPTRFLYFYILFFYCLASFHFNLKKILLALLMSRGSILFCLSRNHVSIHAYSFHNYSVLSSWAFVLFSTGTLNTPSHSLLVFKFSVEKLTNSLMTVFAACLLLSVLTSVWHPDA